MDKIQELHEPIVCATIKREIDINYPATWQHATITEDMMGRFAEWIVEEGFQLLGELWENIGGRKVLTTHELINLFKQTL